MYPWLLHLRLVYHRFVDHHLGDVSCQVNADHSYAEILVGIFLYRVYNIWGDRCLLIIPHTLVYTVLKKWCQVGVSRCFRTRVRFPDFKIFFFQIFSGAPPGFDSQTLKNFFFGLFRVPHLLGSIPRFLNFFFWIFFLVFILAEEDAGREKSTLPSSPQKSSRFFLEAA